MSLSLSDNKLTNKVSNVQVFITVVISLFLAGGASFAFVSQYATKDEVLSTMKERNGIITTKLAQHDADLAQIRTRQEDRALKLIKIQTDIDWIKDALLQLTTQKQIRIRPPPK